MSPAPYGSITRITPPGQRRMAQERMKRILQERAARGGVGTAPVPASTPAPTTVATDPTTELLKRQLGDIGNYNLARAEILKSISPSILAGYRGAADDIARYGEGVTGDIRSSLGAQGAAAQGSFEGVTGGQLKRDIAGSYNADEAAQAAYTLGAYFPARGLAEQGAHFGAAAAFLPGAALQQGAYQLDEAQDKALAALAKAKGAAGANKVSASLSERLEYLVDVYGNPIRDKKGKIIPLKPEGLTPYQQAQLDIARGKEGRYIDAENFDQWKATQDLSFKTAADARAAKKLAMEGAEIDTVASRQFGYVVTRDGRHFPKVKFKEKPSTSAPRQTPYQKAVELALSDELRGTPIEHTLAGYYLAKPGKGERKVGANQTEITTNPADAMREGGIESFEAAVVHLMARLGITRAQARKALRSSGWRSSSKKTERGRFVDPPYQSVVPPYRPPGFS